jgi:hypothetical protein
MNEAGFRLPRPDEGGFPAPPVIRRISPPQAARLCEAPEIHTCSHNHAPSTMLRMVPLPRFAGEEPAAPLLLPRVSGGGG